MKCSWSSQWNHLRKDPVKVVTCNVRRFLLFEQMQINITMNLALGLGLSVACLRVMQIAWSKVRIKVCLRCKCFGAQRLFASEPDSVWSCSNYLLEYRFVQVWIKTNKAEPCRLIARKATANVELLSVLWI